MVSGVVLSGACHPGSLLQASLPAAVAVVGLLVVVAVVGLLMVVVVGRQWAVVVVVARLPPCLHRASHVGVGGACALDC